MVHKTRKFGNIAGRSVALSKALKRNSVGILYGTKFYTPPPPTPENKFPGVGVYKRGGGSIKFLPRGASKYTPPPPSPEKCLTARNRGRGRGAAYIYIYIYIYIISPWILGGMGENALFSRKICY